MTADPSKWDPSAATDASRTDSEYGLVSRLSKQHGPSIEKDPYPDELIED